MDQLKAPVLVPIKTVPGLFISDRFAASSKQQLEANNIVRILSILQPHETWQSLNPAFAEAGTNDQDHQVEIKAIDIDDDPLVDILQHLEEACHWIQAGLESQEHASGESQPGVLVHCKQGISRSGAFIAAFLMRRFHISYATALGLARESRPQICPNSGFEKQLRIWDFCKYSVYLDNEYDDNKGTSEREEKPLYKAWKVERDNLFKKGEEDVNRARFSSLADMAAKFGRRRQEAGEVEGESEGKGKGLSNERADDGLEKTLSQGKRKEAWERVEKMEKDWNERLMRGQIGGGHG